MEKPEFFPDLLVIPFKLVRDKKLDQIDRMLYGVIYWYQHMKDGRCWASNEKMANILGTTVRVIQNSLTSLESNGYIERIYKDAAKRNRLEIKGLVAFGHVSPIGDRQEPNDPQVTRERPVGDRANALQVTRVRLKSNNKDKEHITAPQGGADINALIALFEPVNPSYERLFSNKTQRAAVDRLVKKYGMDKISDTIRFALTVYTKDYAPVITTPLQLEQKLGQLVAFWKKEKSKQPMLVTV